MTDKYTNRNDSLGNLQDGLHSNPFAVPDGYFEDLAKSSLLRIKLRQDMDEGLTVPNGYFDNLSEDIQARIRTEELKDSVAVSGMEVPSGYFEGLSAKLMTAIRDTDKDVVLPSMPPPVVKRMRTRQWLPYAAASLLMLALGLGTYLGVNLSDPNTIAANDHLQAVPDQEIISYLELYAEADYMLYHATHDTNLDEWVGEGFSEEDIEAYFNDTL